MEIDASGHAVRISHPDKIIYPEVGLTKLDLARYYLAVAEGALRGIRRRPLVLVRYMEGAAGPAFYQKRAPKSPPSYVETVTLRFPSGRTAEEVIVDHPAGLVWAVQLGCLELHPHLVRADDLDHPDELRIDLDPGPGVPWSDVCEVALAARDVLEEQGLRSFPKTSGSRGMHLLVRIERKWGFDRVRRAALALAREVERRRPDIATAKWWKEERRGVFLDYNQNAKDRTTAAAYSARPRPDARVSAPLDWDEVATVDPASFTVLTMPVRYAERGDLHARIDDCAGSLDGLLAIAERDESTGLGDAPWPPHFARTASEPRRVAPSRARKPKASAAATDSAGGLGAAEPAELAEEAISGDEVPLTAAPRKASLATGRRQSTMPLLVVVRAWTKESALAGLDRWKANHPAAAALLAADDILVDGMRGRSSQWYRVRINLRHVPEAERPAEVVDPDEVPQDAHEFWRAKRPGKKP